jgi:hypothetical protein
MSARTTTRSASRLAVLLLATAGLALATSGPATAEPSVASAGPTAAAAEPTAVPEEVPVPCKLDCTVVNPIPPVIPPRHEWPITWSPS